MKPFQFRLQTKLDITNLQEQIAREKMQASISIRDEIAEALEKTNNRMKQAEQSIRDLSGKRDTFQKMLLTNEYLPVLKKQEDEIRENLYSAEKMVEQARHRLLERTRETGTLQKLKEKAWALYLHEAKLEEQKIIDEIAINGHFRKNHL